MDRIALLDRLIEILSAERGERAPSLNDEEKPDYFRALCNVRAPRSVSEEFIRLQDEYLTDIKNSRTLTNAADLDYTNGIALWQGDITTIVADAIVNAGNPWLLGCFYPLHNCIDNVIHSAAGVEMRLRLNEMMKGVTDPNGSVRVTPGYNLPAKYVFHTVGPAIHGEVTERDMAELKSCYTSSLDEAERMGLKTIVFPCISTGEYRFPNRLAASVAIDAVRGYKRKNSTPKVVFNVFKDIDKEIYEELLKQ